MKTNFALEILAIARRVLAEQESGRAVDPSRLAWAQFMVKTNQVDPSRARAFSEPA